MAIMDEIQNTARIGETTHWEFKSARGGLLGSFWGTYSATAGAEGGVGPPVLGRHLKACGALPTGSVAGPQPPSLFDTGDFGDLPESSGHLPDDVLVQLRDMAKPVADSGKASGEQVVSVIARHCRGRFLTAQQLADLLNRSTEGLRKRYLTPMTREGKASTTVPEGPHSA